MDCRAIPRVGASHQPWAECCNRVAVVSVHLQNSFSRIGTGSTKRCGICRPNLSSCFPNASRSDPNHNHCFWNGLLSFRSGESLSRNGPPGASSGSLSASVWDSRRSAGGSRGSEKPTAFHHSAQGWPDIGGPTLGHRPNVFHNPERVASRGAGGQVIQPFQG